MRRLSATLLLLSAGVAQAAPLDDWLAVLPPGEVLIIPRLDRVAGPLSDAVDRLERHPALGRWLGQARFVASLRLGFDPLNLEAHALHGLNPEGPALLHAEAIVLPVQDRDAAEDYLYAALSVHPEAARVAGGPGWRTDAGVAAVRGGILFVSRTEALLRRLIEAPHVAPRDLSACPRGRGEADLFALRADPADGCLTLRLDPGRLLIEARLPGVAGRWLAPVSDRLWRSLGAHATAGVVLRLGPRGLRHLRGVAAERAPELATILDGRVAGAAGPGPWDLSLMLGVQRPKAALKALSRWLATLPPGTAQVRPTQRGFALELPLPPALQRITKAKTQRAWVGVRDGLMTLTTVGPLEDPAPGDPLAAPLGGLDRAALRDQAVALFARLTGPPNDGADYADALLPLLVPAGLPAGVVQDAAGALSFLSAHLGALAFKGDYGGGHLNLSLEVVLL